MQSVNRRLALLGASLSTLLLSHRRVRGRTRRGARWPAQAGDSDPSSVTVVIDAAVRHQTLDGFGQADPSVVAWPIPETLSDQLRAVAVDKAYHQVGINLGIIGSLLESPGDYSQRQNDNSDPFVINWAGFNSDSLKLAKKYVIDLAKPYGFTNYYLGGGAPNIRWASPWLAEIRRRDYGTYLDETAEQVLANVIFWKRTYGEELSYYQLGNEQFSGNKCMIDPGRVERVLYGDYGGIDPVRQMVDITKRAGARLRQAGFIKTRFIVGMEETEEVSLRLAAAILSDPAARRYVAAMGYHSYPYGEGYSSTSFILRTSGAGSPDRARVAVRYRLRDLGKQYNVKVWMTENSNGGAPLSYDTFRARAIQIHDEFLYADASAYFGENAIWDLTSQRSHFRNSSLYENEGSIVLVNEDTGAVDITGIGYAIGHYARWVKPGAVRVEASSSNPLVQVSAFRDEEREMVGFVLINNAASTSAVDISLAGLRVTGNLTGEQSAPSSYWKRLAAFAPSSATTFTITLPPTSVTSVGGRLQSAA